jgi:nucleoside-diphosphate-sugar epimerase
MNIVITGCTGFIGRNLISFLSMKKTYNLICIVRPNSDFSFLNNFDVDVVEWDFIKEKPSSLNKKIDVLIHLAGVSPRTGQKNNQIFNENFDVTKKLLDTLNDVDHIIFSSTDIVNLQNGYSVSKQRCEKLIKDSKIKYTILRIGPVFGQGGKNGSASKIINYIIQEKLFPIFNDPKITIQPIYIEDVIKFINKIIMNEKYYNLICNVVGNSISLVDFANTASKILKKPNKSIKLPFFILHFLVILNGFVSRKPLVTSEQLCILKNNANNSLKSNVSLTPLEDSISKFL